MRLKLVFLFAVPLLATTMNSFSAPDGGRQSIGAKKTQPTNPAHDVRQWVGKRFILLESPKRIHHDYTNFSIHSKQTDFFNNRNSDLENAFGEPYYGKFAGKTFTVTTVEPDGTEPATGQPEYKVTLHEPSNAVDVYVENVQDLLPGFAPENELEDAKNQWIGKTLYSRSRELYTYDAAIGVVGHKFVSLGSKLKVTGAVWGLEYDERRMDESNPIWLIVKADDGTEGFSPVAVDEINKNPGRFYNHLPSSQFWTSDPRKLYPWGTKVWNNLISGEIVVGMTKEQVEIGIGEPNTINTDTSQFGASDQWVYDNQYIYFHKNTVSSIQTRSEQAQ